MVVSDTFHNSDGASTNYTLYCIGERGALTNEGLARPMLALFTAQVLILTSLILVAALARRRHHKPAPGQTPRTLGEDRFRAADHHAQLTGNTSDRTSEQIPSPPQDHRQDPLNRLTDTDISTILIYGRNRWHINGSRPKSSPGATISGGQ
ncbi:hypothetical protein [Nocardia sp. NPDC059228]|uniref:hypothetical protein n=1 Tax=Nocardia sp. NPDC059228 TaxID=3346777 RepID=UPI0036962D09